MRTAFSIAAVAASAAAWPMVMQADNNMKRASGDIPNTGVGHQNPVFDAKDQYVDVTDGGPNAFQSPGSGDLRGQCPGLNAAANHGFLPRNGKATAQQTADGLGAAYNMSPELAIFLATYAALISGDPATGTWSIGAGFPGTVPLLSNPTGIVGTHNRYEGDASIVRGDAYLNNGRVGVFQWHSWNNLWNLAGDENNLDYYKIHRQNAYTQQYSESNNPHYFSAPFSGAVTPAAHNFVIGFMSNHSAENPGGFLTREVLSSFFAVTGTGAGASGDNPGDFVQHRGQERIPLNWYRRPSSSQSTLADVALDLTQTIKDAPNAVKIGGNTGTVNSFVGLDIADVSGGAFNAADLLNGNNLLCFATQAAQAGDIDALKFLTAPLKSMFENALGSLGCPELLNYNGKPLAQFPGAQDLTSTLK
ncbi:unnamed protein product [Zymoseptoria tritici ST99CH_1E4]|uniref:Heme haloperoxidase family profile domain-containing protein n=1 Tax=Zymoseptoria tritici ST99CH_1E4 TaxID=1276532 RepID=A0A2H1FPF3_ZYMTR|nr:unnamed protein product [Zymoseptoria tritici ST99CH_1E4]